MKRIKVLVIDDSAVVRQVATEALRTAPDIVVLGAAADPLLAMARMQVEWPDVLVLDIEMPRMDGITFLKKIMAERPTPTVICSSLTESGARTTMEAMAAGAVEIITKPKIGVRDFLSDSAQALIDAVRAASQSNLARLRRPAPASAAPAVALQVPAVGAMTETTDKVVAIGTSTGGTRALETILTALPPICPGMLIVQHMPEKFTAQFAERLDSICAVEVREARTGDRVMPGRALIAPGGKHLLLRRSGAQYVAEVRDGPPVNRHKPSVDVLFRSVAEVAGSNALGIIMTGMGDDGARGIQMMHRAGAATVAEDESTCVVFGMPKEAIALGAIDRIVPLDGIAREILAVSRVQRSA